MATLIAQKNKAAEAMNGDATSDGLNAMLGDDGDLQSMLLNSIKNGENLTGSTEEWTALASERTKELLANIGKVQEISEIDILPMEEQVSAWIRNLPSSYDVSFLLEEAFFNRIMQAIKDDMIPGIQVLQGNLEVNGDTTSVIRVLSSLGVKKEKRIVSKELQSTVSNLFVFENQKKTKGKKRVKIEEGQIGFDLFG